MTAYLIAAIFYCANGFYAGRNRPGRSEWVLDSIFYHSITVFMLHCGVACLHWSFWCFGYPSSPLWLKPWCKHRSRLNSGPIRRSSRSGDDGNCNLAQGISGVQTNLPYAEDAATMLTRLSRSQISVGCVSCGGSDSGTWFGTLPHHAGVSGQTKR